MFQMGTNMQRPKGGRGYRILKERLELQAKPKQGCLVGQVRDDAILQLLDNTDCFKQGSYMIRLVYFRKFTLSHYISFCLIETFTSSPTFNFHHPPHFLPDIAQIPRVMIINTPSDQLSFLLLYSLIAGLTWLHPTIQPITLGQEQGFGWIVFFLESLRENLFPYLFQLLGSTHIP